MKIQKLLLNHSPYENYWTFIRAVRRRLGRGSLFTMADVCSTRKYCNPLVEIDRFARYGRVIKRFQKGWVQPDFSDSVVLELGCGPLLGIAPIAVYSGARRFFYSEPAFSRDLIQTESVRNGYFTSFHQELLSQCEPGRSEFVRFEDFYNNVLDRCCDFRSAGQNERIDFLYSNSVLEHVDLGDFPTLLQRLRSQSSSCCRYVHVVDFSDHHDRPMPFAGIYRSDPTVNPSHRAINLLRPSEVKSALEEAGFPCEMIVYRRYSGDLVPMNEYWCRFPEEELRVEVAFFVNPQS